MQVNLGLKDLDLKVDNKEKKVYSPFTQSMPMVIPYQTVVILLKSKSKALKELLNPMLKTMAMVLTL